MGATRAIDILNDNVVDVPSADNSDRGEIRAVIVSYQARPYLQACLASLADIPQIGEIVVVDNASTDGTLEFLRESGFDQPERSCPGGRVLIANPANAGFAAAVNQGAAGCELPYVLLLNCDVELDAQAVAALVAHLEADPRAAAACARLLTADGRDQLPFATNRSHRVKWAPGACLLLRSAPLEEVGWLDPEFFFYNEDVDLGIRLRRRGWRIVYASDARVLHHEGKSTDAVRHETIVHGYRGGFRILAKHYPWALAAGQLAIRAEIRLRAAWYRRLRNPSAMQLAYLKAYPALREL